MKDTKKSVEDFIKFLKEKKVKIETEEGKAIGKCCALIQSEAQRSMTETKVNFDVSYGKHGHHPSLPFNAPAVDTGLLRMSITYTVEERNGKIIGKVGSTLQNPPYGAYLETGTSRMPEPRPWLKPAIEKTKDRVNEILKSAVRGAK